MQLAPEAMRLHTEQMLPVMAKEFRRINRDITRWELASALVYREALRSVGRFAAADELRQQLCIYGCFVRDTDRANQLPGYFVIFSDEKKSHIIDRGWVPTYSLMQQYILRQCSLEKVLTWMFGNSEDAGIGQFPRQAEHPTVYANHRAGNRYVCEGRTYAMRMSEEDGPGAEGRRYAPPHPKAAVSKGECDKSKAPGSADAAASRQPERRAPTEGLERAAGDELDARGKVQDAAVVEDGSTTTPRRRM